VEVLEAREAGEVGLAGHVKYVGQVAALHHHMIHLHAGTRTTYSDCP
jgi:hypothetical protein